MQFQNITINELNNLDELREGRVCSLEYLWVLSQLADQQEVLHFFLINTFLVSRAAEGQRRFL